MLFYDFMLNDAQQMIYDDHGVVAARKFEGVLKTSSMIFDDPAAALDQGANRRGLIQGSPMNIKHRYSFTHCQALLSLAALLLASHSLVSFAAGENVWDSAYDAQAKARYIPVELWTGGKWDGTRELKMNPADLYFGGHKHIVGPIPYIRPSTGDSILVYKKINRGKSQLFTLSSRGDGLGRVFDSRYGRDCNDEVKMPLGLWHEDETRVFEVACNQGALVRKIQVTIEKLDFEYGGIPHSLSFHWLVNEGKDRGTDMHYIYSPGAGLVSEFGNE